jgi:hypothetical protein
VTSCDVLYQWEKRQKLERNGAVLETIPISSFFLSELKLKAILAIVTIKLHKELEDRIRKVAGKVYI